MNNKLLFVLLLVCGISYAQETITNDASDSDNSDTETFILDNQEASDNLIILDNTLQKNTFTVDIWQQQVQNINKDYQKIEDLIIAKGWIDRPVIDGNTLLILSAMQSNENLEKIGIKHGGNIYLKNTYDETAIHWAAASNNLNIIQNLFIKTPIDLNQILTKQNLTPLHYNILYSNNILITKFLLKYQSNLEAKDINGLTPLHYAVMFDKIEQAKLLVANGYSMSSKDNEGQSVEDYVVNKSSVDMMNALYNNLSKESQSAIKLRASNK